MKLRRGFKSEANKYAREFRAELGLRSHDSLNPWHLAEHLAIPVNPLSELRDEIPDAVSHVMEYDQAAFSAVTLCQGYKRLIIHNDAHHPKRQANNIAHELGHAILGHPPMPPLNDYGCRNFNRELEDEADWLGATLLISEEAALHIAELRMTVCEASDRYGVSEKLVQWRLNATAAFRRVAKKRS